MDKELQDLAWSILPKEFKEDVKKYYCTLHEQYKDYDGLHLENAKAKVQERIVTVEYFFGKYNLTSDAEGEEMLYVKAKTVREMYAANDRLIAEFIGSEIAKDAAIINNMLRRLFGSKCLPDNVDSLDGNVDSLANLLEKPTPSATSDTSVTSDTSDTQTDPEPCTEPEKETSPNVNNSDIDIEELIAKGYVPDPAQHFDNILKDSFSKERRLNIAAMAMQGMLSNTTRFSSYEISDLVRISLNCADALIAESELTDKLKGE